MPKQDYELNRRSVLKSIPIGSIGLAVGTGKVSAQSSYDVSVSTSEGLYEDYGAEILDKAVEYVKGAFNDVGISSYVTKGEYSVPAPVEEHNKQFTAETPCAEYEVQYDGLLSWWRDYVTVRHPIYRVIQTY